MNSSKDIVVLSLHMTEATVLKALLGKVSGKSGTKDYPRYYTGRIYEALSQAGVGHDLAYMVDGVSYNVRPTTPYVGGLALEWMKRDGS